MTAPSKIDNIPSVNPRGGLTRKVVSGGFWVLSVRVFGKLLGLARTIILARFLAPEDFGLMGIALLALSIMDTFSRTGFREKIIQKEGETESYLNTAWTVEFLRDSMIAIILLIGAPYIAAFFKNSDAIPIIRLIGLAHLATGLTNIGILFWNRELEFKRLFIFEISGNIADFIIAVFLAIIWKDVRALVFGLLGGKVVRLIASYILHPWRPKFAFDKSKAAEMFNYGKWLLISNVLIFLAIQGDDIFVGKYLGVVALGFYQMAYKISNLPATEITHVISKVTMPAYARLQIDKDRIREAYFRVLKINLAISFPVAGLIFLVAPEFVSIVLGDKWVPIVPAIYVLSFYGAIRALSAVDGALFRGTGNPRFETIISLARLSITIAIIYPLTKHWGIVGTSAAVTIPLIVTHPYNLVKSSKIIGSSIPAILKLIMPPFLAVLISLALPLFLFSELIQSGFSLFVKCFSFFGIYIVTIYVLDKSVKGYNISNSIREVVLLAKKSSKKFHNNE